MQIQHLRLSLNPTTQSSFKRMTLALENLITEKKSFMLLLLERPDLTLDADFPAIFQKQSSCNDYE